MTRCVLKKSVGCCVDKVRQNTDQPTTVRRGTVGQRKLRQSREDQGKGLVGLVDSSAELCSPQGRLSSRFKREEIEANRLAVAQAQKLDSRE